MVLNVAGRTREVLIEYKRIKNIYLRVNEDGSLRITCSRYVTQKQIREFILSKEKWIARTETTVQKRTNACSYGENGEDAMWLGRRMPVMSVKDTKDFLEVREDALVYHLRLDTPENRMRVFYNEAGKHLIPMIQKKRPELDENVCRLYHKPLPRITVKYMTSRWGSCTPTKAHISISCRLIHYPPECLDYVMTHEYAHILVANHSKLFWQEVEIRMPGYKEVSKLLKE